MRLDFFLPFRREAEQGPLRRALGLLGPSWRAAPLRRIVQTVCLLAFAWLFFRVCWPYTAQPAPPPPAPRAWDGWLPVEVDAETGKVVVEVDKTLDEPIAVGVELRATDRGSGAGTDVGVFRVSASGERRLSLEVTKELRPEQADALSASLGPWSLREIPPPPPWPSHYADDLVAKETIPAETFLAIDPLVSISTALAAKTWVWSLAFAGATLAVCLLIPRGFCGYVCPLGTLIDAGDWLVGRRIGRQETGTGSVAALGPELLTDVPATVPVPVSVTPRLAAWWRRLKYYLLMATLVSSLFGVLLTGFVAAIPVVTRGMAFLLAPLQTGAARGWHQVPPIGAGHYVSIALFLAVLLLGLLRPRFWCKYVCPSGAVFSCANLLRLTERKVAATCIACGKCVKICPFDAIEADFSTRTADCTFCQTCGGVCPVGAIAFVGRWQVVGQVANLPEERQVGNLPHVPRRRFLGATIGSAVGAVGGLAVAAATRVFGARLDDPEAWCPVRPPGSVPEREFLQLCIRCGECFRVCPNDAIQPLGFQQGLEGLWTPHVAADWSGCEPSCANCGQVCPTGAIRALTLEEKRHAHIGLALVNKETCLPYAGLGDCQLCRDECETAGYHAIIFERVGGRPGSDDDPETADPGFLAPKVLADKCVGCGLCQTRCLAINATQKGLLDETAIRVEAGNGREDRLTSGSYVELREAERRCLEAERRALIERSGGSEEYLPPK